MTGWSQGTASAVTRGSWGRPAQKQGFHRNRVSVKVLISILFTKDDGMAPRSHRRKLQCFYALPQGFLFFMHGHRASYFSCTATGLSIFHARKQGFLFFMHGNRAFLFFLDFHPQKFIFFMPSHRASHFSCTTTGFPNFLAKSKLTLVLDLTQYKS